MRLKATICELGNDASAIARDWERLVAHVRAESSDLVVLPEMTFSPWFAVERQFDQAAWEAAVEAHDRWLERLPDLAPAAVVGTRPVCVGDRRLNQGFVCDEQAGYRPVHAKYYLPDEAGFWEASWYDRGDADFTAFRSGGLRAGMLICTELWFMERARAYGKAGIHLLVAPRATPRETLDKWLAGGRAAAVVAGAFALSSNRISGADETANLGGQGWAVSPDGDVLGLTSREQQFVTVALDLAEAERAKQTYPRYVPD
jgi:N-carbamoylputrescine amidase